MEEDIKTKILLSQLEERYNALHKMRDRSTKFAIWVVGLILFWVSWTHYGNNALTVPETIFMTIVLLFGESLAWKFVSSIEAGFIVTRELASKIETALGLQKKGEFVDDDSILPEAYKHSGRRKNDHFRTIYILLIGSGIISIVTLWYPHI